MKASFLSTLSDWFNQTWHVFTQHSADIYKVYALVWVWSVVSLVLNKTAFTGLIQLFNIFILPILLIGVEWYILNIVRGKTATFNNLTYGFKHYGTILITAFYVGIKAGVGFVLFIIPGIIWLLEYYFAVIAIIDKDKNIRDSLEFSKTLTQGYRWPLFIIFLLRTFVGTLGIPFSFSYVQTGLTGIRPLFVVLMLIGWVIAPLTLTLHMVIYDSLLKAKHIK